MGSRRYGGWAREKVADHSACHSVPRTEALWDDDDDGDDTNSSTVGEPVLSNIGSVVCDPFTSNEGSWRAAASQPISLHAEHMRTGQSSHYKRGFQDRNAQYRNINELKFNIDKDYVGKVIGRSGAKIKEFQDESGARIRVIGDSDPAVVVVKGSTEAQEKAKNLIESYVDSMKSAHDAEVINMAGNQQPSNEPFDWDAVWKAADEYDKAKQKKFAELNVQKDFYVEHATVKMMSRSEVEKIREEKHITITKYDQKDARIIPNAVVTFNQAFEPHPEIMSEILRQGFTEPSPIQCQAWPILLKGYDLIAIAQTGTGKTLAFLLPALIHIESQVTPKEKREGPTCLILAPTRELALQILEETKKYCYRGIKSICLYGGQDKRIQIDKLTENVEIVIATPGRLIDLHLHDHIVLDAVTYLVLDEADRMLDLGFRPQLNSIVRNIAPCRQTVMTSATFPDEVQELVDLYLKEPFKVNIGSLDLSAVHSVEQHFIFVESDQERRKHLDNFLKNMMKEEDKVLVFVDRKAVVEDVASDLVLWGYDCQSIHGGRDQDDRENALEDFKTGEARILIATDLAARGLDVKDVTVVINMYMPMHIEEYVHRIGRTGRAGRSGMSVTMIGRKDWDKAGELVKIVEEACQYVPDELIQMAKRYQHHKETRPPQDGRGHRRGHGRPRY